MLRAVGTPQYAAPEMLRNEKHGEPADVWSFGCTLYEMYAGDSDPAFGLAREFNVLICPR